MRHDPAEDIRLTDMNEEERKKYTGGVDLTAIFNFNKFLIQLFIIFLPLIVFMQLPSSGEFTGHPKYMTIGLTCLLEGVFLLRTFNNSGKSIYMKLHLGFQVGGLIFLFIGISIAFATLNIHLSSWHSIIGLLTFASLNTIALMGFYSHRCRESNSPINEYSTTLKFHRTFSPYLLHILVFTYTLGMIKYALNLYLIYVLAPTISFVIWAIFRIN